MNKPTPRRKDTRQRIEAAALELFVEHGYEKTSLRTITDRLGITKAALYYYFPAKEDILAALSDRLLAGLDDLVTWGQQQPRTPETKQELLRRYSSTLVDAAPILHLVQDNQASLRLTSIGQRVRERISSLAQLIVEPDAALTDNVRGISALFTVYFGPFALQHVQGDAEEKRRAVLDVALELITPGPAAGSPDTPTPEEER
ncbi:TetR family transcriptional regulator [Krasilnikovia sp. MM14-A1004]|uniref:TetR/AcrR family transcriptional regulator n=1 Tax=Krasilnikovia sp. MM14-A1004 TaxID=3373541 RepID=UPI00399C6CCC